VSRAQRRVAMIGVAVLAAGLGLWAGAIIAANYGIDFALPRLPK
jgi:hypothetical protein